MYTPESVLNVIWTCLRSIINIAFYSAIVQAVSMKENQYEYIV